jgi:pyridinium-3,5-biscarboxylic acid mononucleotide sulfurtransferase
MTVQQKFERLQHILRQCGSVCIGYSGGVDSVYLAVAAVDTLGGDSVLAVTGHSAAYPAVQNAVALECAHGFGIPHTSIETDELSDPNYASNPSNRCYYCKSELWPKLVEVARARGLRTVLDGSNADDADDYRPGAAAAREHGVRSPLQEAGLTKAEIRHLSRQRGLPTWDQPAAPCLSSRLPYGIAVTVERLRQVETAESLLRDLGFREFRVRHHDDCLRVEVAPSELDAAAAAAAHIADAFAMAALPDILIDAEGYRRGALNEVLLQIEPRTSRDDALPAHGVAGYHRDICVLPGRSLGDARACAAAARAAGYNYIAVRAAALCPPHAGAARA